jgi:hypothetical protein
MKKTGKNLFLLRICLWGAVQAISTGLHAQRADTSLVTHATLAPGTSNDFLKDLGPQSLRLGGNFSIQTGGLFNTRSIGNMGYASTGAGLYGTGTGPYGTGNAPYGTGGVGGYNLRRPDFGLKDVRFNLQNFSLGASYNGLDNMFRSGFSGGGASRNPGLSIHAGLRF